MSTRLPKLVLFGNVSRLGGPVDRRRIMAKILLVEDDVDFNALICTYLKNENHVVDAVFCCEDAQALCETGGFDVILLDWNLPGMEGVDFLKWIRAKGANEAIIMMTGKGAVPEREEGLDSGADDYLVKPFAPRELLARIRAVLRRPSLVVPTLSIGAATLNPGSLSVTLDGVEVRLPPREFAVLEFLARHPNQVFTPEALMSRVWKMESEASIDSLRTAIKLIRKRVSPGIIETITGAGYKAGN